MKFLFMGPIAKFVLERGGFEVTMQSGRCNRLQSHPPPPPPPGILMGVNCSLSNEQAKKGACV